MSVVYRLFLLLAFTLLLAVCFQASPAQSLRMGRFLKIKLARLDVDRSVNDHINEGSNLLDNSEVTTIHANQSLNDRVDDDTAEIKTDASKKSQTKKQKSPSQDTSAAKPPPNMGAMKFVRPPEKETMEATDGAVNVSNDKASKEKSYMKVATDGVKVVSSSRLAKTVNAIGDHDATMKKLHGLTTDVEFRK